MVADAASFLLGSSAGVYVSVLGLSRSLCMVAMLIHASCETSTSTAILHYCVILVSGAATRKGQDIQPSHYWVTEKLHTVKKRKANKNKSSLTTR